jgi:SpoVK/Ycf46/Vps4 family AAA+-type ATPase
MVISELFSSLYGIKDGDWVHVRRVHGAVCQLQSAILVPLSKKSDLNSPDLKRLLTREAHIASQGGVVLLSASTEDGKVAGAPLNAYYVLHTTPLLQGTLCNDTTVTVIPIDNVLRGFDDAPLSNGNSSLANGKIEHMLPPAPKIPEPKNQITRLRDIIDRYQNRIVENGPSFSLTNSELASSTFSPSGLGKSPSRRPLLVSSFMNMRSPTLAASSSRSPSTRVISSPGSPLAVAASVISKLAVKQLATPLRVLQPAPATRDLPLECGVTLHTLKSLQIFSGSHVLISSETSASRHVGRLFALPSSSSDFEDGCLYLSPILVFNLGLDTTRPSNYVTIKDISQSVARIVSASGHLPQVATPSNSNPSTPSGSPAKPSTTPSMGSSFVAHSNGAAAISPPPFASEAYISRVRCPRSSNHAVYRKALQEYFSQPRLFKQGDLFTVVVKRKRFLCAAEVESLDFDEDDDMEDDLSGDDDADSSAAAVPTSLPFENPSEQPVFDLAFFKLDKVSTGPDSVESEFVWIDSEHTTLYQEGSLSSRIPTAVDAFLLASGNTVSCPPAGMTKVFQELCTLTRPCLHPMSPQLGLHFSMFLHGRSGSGKRTLLTALASHLGVHLYEMNCYSLIGSADTETEARLRATFKEAVEMVPCILVLRNIDAFEHSASAQERQDPAIAAALRDLIQSTADINRTHKEPLIVVGTSSNLVKVSKTIRACFRQEIGLEMPDEKQRLEIIDYATSRLALDRDVSLKDLALRTASFSPRDLVTMVAHSSTVALNRIVEACIEKDHVLDSVDSAAIVEADVCAAGVVVSADDFDKSITALQHQHSAALGTPKIPNIKWEDVGGLMDAKKEILDTIQLPLQHPELFASGMRTRSGILLFGPPGTGKTLLAKAIATECNLNFISVKGPELINMYVGESEKNVRAVFQKARDARPCVIFFDELDSLAPNRGRNGDSGGVMDRIVSQLLAELSAMTSGSSDVFVIGATNRPDLIDPALLVPGRFDKLIYLGVNTDQKSRENVRRTLFRYFFSRRKTDRKISVSNRLFTRRRASSSWDPALIFLSLRLHVQAI